MKHRGQPNLFKILLASNNHTDVMKSFLFASHGKKRKTDWTDVQYSYFILCLLRKSCMHETKKFGKVFYFKSSHLD